MISVKSTATKEIAMDVVAYERWNEVDGANEGLVAQEDTCPEWGELSEDFCQIYH
jgi:hypothetical protein